jgi:hypothetical protein
VLNERNNPFNYGWNGYLLQGGLFYLHTLKMFEEGQSILHSNEEIPAADDKKMDIMLQIVRNKSNFFQSLDLFKELPDAFRLMDHPPTAIRIQLINDLVNKELQRSNYETETNNIGELPERMLFALQYMNRLAQNAFHNAYQMREYLNKTYN